MWDARLGQISFTTHRISLEPVSRSVTQYPYPTESKAREFVAEEVERMRKANIIEPEPAELASPIVVVHKHERSFCMSIGYRKLNAVIMRETYPLPQMDDCINTLGDATVFSKLNANWA